MAFKFKKLFEDNDDEMQSVSEDEFYSISKEDAVKEADKTVAKNNTVTITTVDIEPLFDFNLQVIFFISFPPILI